MRRVVVFCVLMSALCLPQAGLADGVVSVFYYPWFSGLGSGDNHWVQAGYHLPDIDSDYYPSLGPYSTGSYAVLDTQMAEIASAGIDEIAVSWWGRGSTEDQRLPAIIGSAEAHHLAVAVELEPYGGRTVAGTASDIQYLMTLGIRTFYVYEPFETAAPTDWSETILALRAQGLTLFAQTGLVGQGAAADFNGVYTYDILTYGARELGRYCAEAHRVGLLCAPSVGPGFDARRATGNPNVLPRRDGATYDAMWRAALKAGADRVTITSFNEWQEGTQIEPADPPQRLGDTPYGSYDGAWGLEGKAASTAYLDRTAYWAAKFHAETENESS
jgi:glycoprotein endo-alpha-1,2-mannosidase